ETARPAAADEVRRGAVTVKALTSMLSATAVEAEVELAFRFRLEGGRWRAEAARVSGGEWVELARVASALNAEKAARARAEMRAVGAALEAFRRERGFYVVSDSHVVLIDHLNPRYMKPVVRLDPWHRPYRYRGTRDAYRITSDGADGRENTDDDLNVASGP
ncbi:MAG TPA: type II secretion system protein GspG, partial [Pyrinomonadaceae bacterium]|nr:type II secretion system protein GspG [Pyrinomonadaceae bacterium]